MKSWFFDSIRPVLSLIPRGGTRVLNILGGGVGADANFLSCRNRYRCFYDCDIKAFVSVDLREWGGRWYYYTGKYYDRKMQLAISYLLGSGDTFVDIGANVGIHSIYASRVVGECGAVYSFEPNPRTYELLLAHKYINRIGNLHPFNLGLGEEKAEVVLSGYEEHSGTFSMLPQLKPRTVFNVAIDKGDTVLENIQMNRRTMLKIDVEGYEYSVLRGMRQFLQNHEDLVCICEVTPEWTARMGHSAEEIYDDMRILGYTSFLPELKWVLGLFRPRISFKRVDRPCATQHDVLFVKEPLCETLQKAFPKRT